MSRTELPLTAMDAALLRDLVGKVDNRIDGRALLSVADSIDAVLAAVEEERYEHEEALRQQYAAGFIEARGWRPNPDSMGHWVDPIDGSRFNGYGTALDRERHRTEQSLCSECGHTHVARLGGICVGCPCPKRQVPDVVVDEVLEQTDRQYRAAHGVPQRAQEPEGTLVERLRADRFNCDLNLQHMER